MIYDVVPLAYVVREINPDKPLFCDTETDGLYGSIELVQFMQDDWETALLVEKPDRDKLRKMMENLWTIWHNSSYDLSTLDVIPELFDDTFLLARLEFFDKDVFSLDAVYEYALHYDPYEEADINKKVMQKTRWAGKLTHEHFLYAAIDVYYMPELWKRLELQRKDSNYRLDIATIKHCIKMQRNGLPLLSLAQELKEVSNEIEIVESILPVNPRSFQQVASYLNMPDGTGADKLAVLISKGGEKAEKAEMVRKARELSKYRSTYLSKMVGHPRWYGHFAPTTRSGRLASKNNNLQNLPRKMKKFVGVDDGKVLISADFAQLEMRTIACIANDTTMIELFNAGEDLHGFMAKIIFGENYTPEQRQIAKVANFSLLYGAGAAKYASILLSMTGIIISESEALRIKNTWLNTFRGIRAWQQQGIKQWRAGNYHWTPMGRRYKAKMLNDYLNIENQGAGADIAKLAFNYIMNSLPDNAMMVNFVHDSYLAECDNDPEIYKPVAELFAVSMQQAWAEYQKVEPRFGLIRMPVSVGVAKTWKDADGMADTCEYILEIE